MTNKQNDQFGQQHLLAAISSLGNGNSNGQGQLNNVNDMQGNSLFGQGRNNQLGGMPKSNASVQEHISEDNLAQQLMLMKQGTRDIKSDQMGRMGSYSNNNMLRSDGTINDLQMMRLQQQSMQTHTPNQDIAAMDTSNVSVPNLSKMAEFCATRGEYQ